MSGTPLYEFDDIYQTHLSSKVTRDLTPFSKAKGQLLREVIATFGDCRVHDGYRYAIKFDAVKLDAVERAEAPSEKEKWDGLI